MIVRATPVLVDESSDLVDPMNIFTARLIAHFLFKPLERPAL